MSPIRELIEAVKDLKVALSDEGPYSIALTSGRPMGWADAIIIGNILEALDKALERAEFSEGGFDVR